MLPGNQSISKVVANAPAKQAPLPVAKIEESRKLNAELIKNLPIEVELKTQSVAI